MGIIRAEGKDADIQTNVLLSIALANIYRRRELMQLCEKRRLSSITDITRISVEGTFIMYSVRASLRWRFTYVLFLL